ncbi:hypothetical protein ACHAW6_008975 [Cyclotella cf. meneghiniana]
MPLLPIWNITNVLICIQMHLAINQVPVLYKKLTSRTLTWKRKCFSLWLLLPSFEVCSLVLTSMSSLTIKT